MATKPLLTKIWGNSAPAGDLESPTDPKFAEGWLFGEKPPHKFMNWLQWTFSKAFAHLNERGVLEWDVTTPYLKGACVWSGNKVYQARVANTGQSVALPTQWQEQSLPDMPTSGNGFILYYSGSKLFWKDHKDLAYTAYQGRVAGDNKPLVIPNDNAIGNAPLPAEINIGELALNFKDKALYTKNPEGAIIQLGGAVSIVDFEFTLTAGQTTVQPAGGYTVNQIEVFLNGRKLAKSEYVANDGVNVVLNLAGKLDDFMVVSVWGAFTVSNAYTQAQVDALLTAQEATLQALMLGVNQTYQNVAGTRAIDTIYTNTTGKPISVNVTIISASVSTDAGFAFNVDGVRIALTNANPDVGSNARASMTIIVPDGSTYEVTSVTGSINYWFELR